MHSKTQGNLGVNFALTSGNPLSTPGNLHHFSGLSAFTFPGANTLDALSCGVPSSLWHLSPPTQSQCGLADQGQHSGGSNNVNELGLTGVNATVGNNNLSGIASVNANALASTEDNRYFMKMVNSGLAGLAGYPSMPESQIASLLGGGEIPNLLDAVGSMDQLQGMKMNKLLQQQVNMIQESPDGCSNESKANEGAGFQQWNRLVPSAKQNSVCF